MSSTYLMNVIPKVVQNSLFQTGTAWLPLILMDIGKYQAKQ